NAAVAVKIYGNNLEALDRTAERVARVLSLIKVSRVEPEEKNVPAFANVLIEPQTGAPELVVRPRWEDASRLGLRNAQILDAIHTAFQGAEIAPVYDRNRIVDLTVLLTPSDRNDPDTVANLWLSVPSTAGAKPSPAAAGAADAGENRVQLKQ